MEIALARYRLALKGARMPPVTELKRLWSLVEDILSADPANLKALYYAARLEETLGRGREALLMWSRLIRTVPASRRAEPWVSWLLDEALAAKRRLGEPGAPRNGR